MLPNLPYVRGCSSRTACKSENGFDVPPPRIDKADHLAIVERSARYCLGRQRSPRSLRGGRPQGCRRIIQRRNGLRLLPTCLHLIRTASAPGFSIDSVFERERSAGSDMCPGSLGLVKKSGAERLQLMSPSYLSGYPFAPFQRPRRRASRPRDARPNAEVCGPGARNIFYPQVRGARHAASDFSGHPVSARTARATDRRS